MVNWDSRHLVTLAALTLTLAACGTGNRAASVPTAAQRAAHVQASPSSPVELTSTLRPTGEPATGRPATSTASPAPAKPTPSPVALTPTRSAAPAASSQPGSSPTAISPTLTPPAGSPVPLTATSLPPTSAPPTPTVAALLPQQPLIPPAGVRVYETELSIPTYDYEGALTPTQPEDPIYPYPRLDASLVGGKSPRSYRAVVLENAYVRVTILPELGGRVYAWLDKTTGQAIAYSNPVIKPTHWGYRGWWLATGGIEWCLPTDEHGLNEYRPWQTTLGGASVTVSDHEDRTGLDVQVTLSLAHSSLIVQPRIANDTGTPQRFKFWINAMLAFAGNRVGPSTRTIMPTGQATIHSTSDSGLPGAGTVIDWPVYNGRDVSVIGKLDGWLGIFASPKAQANFAGAYDEAAELGIVRVFPGNIATGVKFFSGQGIDPATWTDDGSTYLEMWGGLTPTFADEATIESGQTWSWTERWYPVNGLEGGYDYANDTAALRLQDRGSSVYAGVAASVNLTNARIRLWQAGQVVAEWSTSLGPGRPASAVWQPPAGGCEGENCGRLGLQVLDSAGSVLAQTGLTVLP